ncbi:MAG TPA: hypothetical protein VFQ30_18300 [Ktedonobacteraceae bacterium]|nr:hypothetical protein [Ktedonobacteraceae bacterium]
MAEHYAKRVHTEHAVLDIGQDIGALVLYTGAEFCGKEIEISPWGNDAHRTHTAIWERRFNGRSVFAGIFPSLPAGNYILWKSETEAANSVTIAGGQIAEVDWRQ